MLFKNINAHFDFKKVFHLICLENIECARNDILNN